MSSLWSKMRSLSAVAVFALFACVPSFAAGDIVITETINAAIPDNDPSGLSSTINIADVETINGISVSLNGIGHTWVGDLVVTLQGPRGQSITIMDRTGTGTFNDSSNLAISSGDGGQQSYTFVDTGGSWWTEASAGDTFYDMAAGNYQASDANGTSINMNAIVAGDTTDGAWTLNISDNLSGDTGTIVSWTIAIASTAATVPEPGAFGLLTVVSLVALRRRRG